MRKVGPGRKMPMTGAPSAGNVTLLLRSRASTPGRSAIPKSEMPRRTRAFGDRGRMRMARHTKGGRPIISHPGCAGVHLIMLVPVQASLAVPTLIKCGRPVAGASADRGRVRIRTAVAAFAELCLATRPRDRQMGCEDKGTDHPRKWPFKQVGQPSST
jgi:hypothetical protein